MDYYNLPSDKAILISLKAAIVHEGKVLMMQSTAGHKNWELPGGLLDIEEEFEDGLKREVREETTLNIEVGKVLYAWDGWRKGFIFKDGTVRDVRVFEIVYNCELVSGDIELSEEHSEFRWATAKEISSMPMFSEQREAVEAHIGKER